MKKWFVISLITFIIINNIKIYAAQQLPYAYTNEQIDAMERSWSDFVNNVKPNGSVEIYIPTAAGITGKDLVQYASAHNLGANIGGNKYKLYKSSFGMKMVGYADPDLKKEIMYVNDYVLATVSEMEPTLENVKYLYNKMVTTFDYVDNNSCSTYTLLTTNVGKCRDYASLFSKMLSEMGIENYCVIGTLNGCNHMWNMFKLNDSVYTVDVTKGISYRKAGYDNWQGFEKNSTGVLDDNYTVDSII